MRTFLRILAAAVVLSGTILLAQDAPQKQPAEDGRDEVYQVGRGVSLPKKISGAEPQFSNKARKARLQGTVTLKVIVTPEGTTRDITVVKGLGSGLDEKAVEAVNTWKFEPAMKDGHPVAVHIYVQVDFKLY